MLTEKECYFWLYQRKGIGKAKRERLLSRFGTAGGVFGASEEELAGIPSLTAGDRKELLSGRDEARARREYERLSARGIVFSLRDEEGFPERLRHIYDSPDALFWKGSPPREGEACVAIVGARECSPYGLEMAGHFARELARAGVGVVSGLARGIDAAAHRGAIEGGGRTYGVLGCGIDRCYPQENLDLCLKMQEAGGVFSEFSLGTAPRAGNFPLRNRIISGLGDGVLIVEARERSGSLITAQLGLEQGKDVFALPGKASDPLSKGCNGLIKEGAFLVDSPDDILRHYEIGMGKIAREAEKGKKFLDFRWEMVYSLLGLEPKHVSDIVEESGLTVAEAAEALLALEERGYVRKAGRGFYVQTVA